MYHYLIRTDGSIALRAVGPSAPMAGHGQVVVSSEALHTPASAWTYDFATKAFVGRTRATKAARLRAVRGTSEDEAVAKEEARAGLRRFLQDRADLVPLVRGLATLSMAEVQVILGEMTSAPAGGESP